MSTFNESEFEFSNRYSLRRHEKLLRNDKEGGYAAYLKRAADPNPFEVGRNSIPDGIHIGFGHVRAVEIYSRNDVQLVRRIFGGFQKRSRAATDGPRFDIKDQVEKVVDSILYDKGSLSFHNLLGFDIAISDPYLEGYSPRLEILGSGLFKLNFVFRVRDEIRLKYWKILAHQFNSTITFGHKLTPRGLVGTVSVVGGNARKRKEIRKLQEGIVQSIEKVLGNQAPGIYLRNYGFTPVLFVLGYDEATLYKSVTNYGPVPFDHKVDPSEFFNIIQRPDGASVESYLQKADANVFVETSKLKFPSPRIQHKFLWKQSTYPRIDDLFWLNIIQSTLFIQDSLIDEVHNTYIEGTLNKRNSKIKENRLKLNQTEAVFDLLMSAHENETNLLYQLRETEDPFVYEIPGHKGFEYFKRKQDSIEHLAKSIREKLPKLSSIYEIRKDEVNERSNFNLQVFVAVLTLVTVLQAVYQCTSSSSERKRVNPSAQEKPSWVKNGVGVLGNAEHSGT